jgi:hypothetical protein
MWRSAGLFILAAPLLLAQGTVEGTVINSITGAPVPSATVELSVTGVKEPVNRTVTGVSGAFRFSDLPPGEYTPAFDADHFYASHSSEPWCKTFKLTAAGETIHADAELAPITSLSGRVLDPDGKPVAGFRVELQNRRMGMSLTTDHYGRFRLPEMAPGTYLLLARPNRGINMPPNSKVSQPSPTKDKTAWAPTYYPGVLDMAQAMRIRAAGGDLVGYDIQLRSVPVYRIRGTLRDEHGNPAEKLPIALTPADIRDFNAKPEAEAVTRVDGSFEFTDVGPGNWRLSAQTRRDGVDLDGFVVVTVSRHDEEDVQIRLAAAFPVEGSVQREAGLKGLYLTAVDGLPRHDRYADVNEGLFRVSNVFPGRYRINPSSAPGHYLAEVRLGEQDVTGQPVDLAPGGPPIRLLYRSDIGRVQGTVEKGANATVVFFPNDKSYPETVRCTPDGKFELRDVKPGDYSAVAFNLVEPDVLQDAAFVQQVTRGAVSVRVEPGGTASVELRLTVWPQ